MMVHFEEGSTLTEIKDFAFQSCKKLREVSLSKTVKVIGEAFIYIYSYHTIYYGGSESDWDNITFDKGDYNMTYDNWMTYATIIYNS